MPALVMPQGVFPGRKLSHMAKVLAESLGKPGGKNWIAGSPKIKTMWILGNHGDHWRYE